jgi:hypothetical protein
MLNPGIFSVYRDIDEGFIGSAINALEDYMDRANVLHPLGTPLSTSCSDEFDSQGSFDLANLNIERQMMIHVCCIKHPCFCIAVLTLIAAA